MGVVVLSQYSDALFALELFKHGTEGVGVPAQGPGR